MKKFFIFGISFVLVGCSFLQEETELSSEKAEEVFADAISGVDDFEIEDKFEASFVFGLQIEDNENNVLPSQLEELKGTAKINYEKSEEDLAASLVFGIAFNNSEKDDIGFGFSLENKKISYVLENISEKGILFLGLDNMFGSLENAVDFLSEYEGVKDEILLSGKEYEEIFNALGGEWDESDLVKNTDKQEELIHKAFLESGVLVFLEGEKKEGFYYLEFEVSSDGLVNFLNRVAEINGEEIDFSKEKDVFEKLQIKGEMVLTEEKDFVSVGGDLFIDRALLESADKDLVLEYEIKLGKEGSFVLELVDAVENNSKANFELDWNMKY